MIREILLFKESAQVAYGGEQEFFSERELVRAQFVAELNEHLGYPLSSLHVDCSVWVEGAGFQQIDVVARDKEGEVMIAAAVQTPQEYESRQEPMMRSLYLKVSALAKIKRVGYLAYYTRWYRKGILHKRQLVVDYSGYPNYQAWQAAGFPSAGVLPEYKKNNIE